MFKVFKPREIPIEYSQYQFRFLKLAVEQGELDLSPSYQRGDEWDLSDQIKLIESVFNRVDIGRVLLKNFDNSQGIMEVIDGKQRITALTDYMANKFEVKGYLYSDLPELDRATFLNHHIGIGFVDGRVSDDKIKEIFLAVNTNGRTVSDEHLDNVRKQLK